MKFNIFNKKKDNTEDTDNLNEEFEIIEEEEIQELDTVLDTNSMHAVYPFSWEEFPDHIESGNNFIRVLTIVAYPKVKTGNWLSELKRKKGNITIVQHFESSNSTKMIDYYNKAIKNKEAELIDQHDPLKKKRLEKAIQSAELQMSKYLDSEVTYLYQSMYVYLQADSLEELNVLTDSVEGTLMKLQLRPITPTKAEYHAFWSAMPIGENLLRDYTYQQSNTEVASSIFPFDDAEILDLEPQSDIEGINKDTESLIAINYQDKRNVLNQNMVVIGTSGVGKTTYMKQKILKYISKGVKIFIIDPENEYADIVDQHGGQVVHLSSNANTKINPMEIFTETVFDNDEQDDTFLQVDMNLLVKNKIQRLKGFFQVIKSDLSQVEKSVLDTALRDVYRNSGILKYNSIDEVRPDEWPILSDLYHKLGELKQTDIDRYNRIEDFYFILDSYVNGSSTLFNGYTNIKVDTDLLCFDLKALQNEPDSQGAAYLNTFSFLWDEITKNNTENIKLFVDEFHFLTQNPDASSFFYQAYKRFRKYNAGAIAGTQQIQDVLDGTMDNGKNVGQAIIGNSYTKVFFGLDNQGLEDIENKLSVGFSEKERRLLKNKKQGEALIINGSKRAFMRVELTREELRLIDQGQYENKYGDEKIDYEEAIKMTPIEEEEALGFQF